MLKSVIKVICLVGFLGLAGCNTLEGIGRDTTAVGESLTGSAVKAKEGVQRAY